MTGSALRVLVVQPSASEVALLEGALQRGGYKPAVTWVETLGDFLRALEEPAFDLILAAYCLPAFDAPAALAALEARRLAIPLVVVARRLENDRVLAAMTAGARGCLGLHQVAALVPTVRQALDDVQSRGAPPRRPDADGRGARARQARIAAETARAKVEQLNAELSVANEELRASAVQMQENLAEVEAANRSLDEAVTRADGARAEADAARERLAFLARASEILASSLDFEATLRQVVRLAVPVLGDWCLVNLLETDATFRALEVAHADPTKAALADWIKAQSFRLSPADPYGNARVLLTGQPELMAEVDETVLATLARDAEHLAVLRGVGMVSAIRVPLVARGRTLGAIAILAAESGRRYTPADLALAEDLARRAALAIDNARLFRAAQEAIREAQAAVRAREAFLARGSHELRTPLTSAIGTLQLLKRALAGRLSEHPEALVAITERSLGSMLALVNDLLDASKLTARADTLVREPVDLDGLVREVCERLRAQAAEKPVHVRVALPPGLAVAADRLRLEQVVVNLLGNAIKFTPAGGDIRVDGERVDGQVVLHVRDTGEGILPEHLERIFEPFSQASRPPERRPRGTGLGLAICRQIVTLHGGRIWAESDGPGRGSTFTVTLPAAQPEHRAA